MTLGDLKTAIEKIEINNPECMGMAVVIDICGIGGACSAIRSISPGFDWHHNKVVIYPEFLLERRFLRNESKTPKLK